MIEKESDVCPGIFRCEAYEGANVEVPATRVISAVEKGNLGQQPLLRDCSRAKSSVQIFQISWPQRQCIRKMRIQIIHGYIMSNFLSYLLNNSEPEVW